MEKVGIFKGFFFLTCSFSSLSAETILHAALLFLSQGLKTVQSACIQRWEKHCRSLLNPPLKESKPAVKLWASSISPSHTLLPWSQSSPLPFILVHFNPGRKRGDVSMGNITASMNGQLVLSKRELETQRSTVSLEVASASAAFRLPQIWQKNLTLGQDVTFASPSADTRMPVCCPICWPFCTIPLETCCTSVWGCTEVNYQQTGKCAKASIVFWAAAPFWVICTLKRFEASWMCSSS